MSDNEYYASNDSNLEKGQTIKYHSCTEEDVAGSTTYTE